MSNQLETNLNLIYNETAKLTPSVLKEGVTILGVTGTYNGEEEELPYVELEYIRYTGTQYIDTMFVPDYDRSFTIDTAVLPSTSDSRYAIISNWQRTKAFSLEISDSNKARAYHELSNNNIVLDLFTGTISTSVANTINFVYNSQNHVGTFTVNGVVNSDSLSTTGTSGGSLLMFIDQTKRFNIFTMAYNLYYLKIYENGVLIRDFIPVKRKLDNEICLYDKVLRAFFTNQGTGNFTAGPEINPDVSL